MNLKRILAGVLIIGLLAACGVRERLQEEAAEAMAEAIMEQATGVDDINIDTDGESISYEVTDENGETVSVDFGAETTDGEFAGLGFSVSLPTGVGSGAVQRLAEGGAESAVTGQFPVTDLTAAEFYTQIEPELTAQGFAYDDPAESGATLPDFEDPYAILGVVFEHPDGINFTVFWGEEMVILGFMQAE